VVTPIRVSNELRDRLRAVELWGRSYAQYIAIRSGNQAVLDGIASMKASRHTARSRRQWNTTEFDEIDAAIDSIL